jgi:ribosomal protein S18 acetylase RimI-like enzyme
MDWAEEHARAEGFDRLSLHVWEDNVKAVKLYRARGFAEIGVARLAPHPRLPGKSASILMRRELAK